MAAAVERALAQGETLIVEAGTGTGKTFAYLVPALLSGLRVVISTGTRHLQDQLFHRDLPGVRSALGVPVRAALLKGRSNYLCHHRLELACGEGCAGREAAQLQSIRDWSGRTRSGDVAELTGIPEDAPIWPRVTSTVDNCLGQQCEYLQECHINRARREAQDADLVVINHHLLCADLVLREEGFGELLPGADAFIIDEAHQLPETASRFFGVSLSSRQLQELAQDSATEYLRAGGELEGLPHTAATLERALQDLRLAMGRAEQRAPWSRLAGEPEVGRKVAELEESLARLGAALETEAPRSRGLDNCHQRAQRLQGLLQQLTGPTPAGQVHWF
ncbi:MAG TPA: ATP-dependent DNA helicase, partial [Gammaproteobacteria bacterium]|nr:ATP-dependent DNA helicase [Gammaproteobacteria bacterium]